MCKHALCQNLSELYAFLIEAVHIPQEALEHNLVLKVCQKCSERLWVYLLTDDDAGWTSALEILVAVLIGFAACECHDLSCDICAELLLACAVLDHNICADLAVLKADKLKRYDVCALMQQLVERMLSVRARLAEDHRSCRVVYRLTETVHRLTVGLHIKLL